MVLAHIHSCLYLLLFSCTSFPFFWPCLCAHLYCSILTLLIGARLSTMRRPMLINEFESSSNWVYSNHASFPMARPQEEDFSCLPSLILNLILYTSKQLEVFTVLAIVLHSPSLCWDTWSSSILSPAALLGTFFWSPVKKWWIWSGF